LSCELNTNNSGRNSLLDLIRRLSQWMSKILIGEEIDTLSTSMEKSYGRRFVQFPFAGFGVKE